jgi:ribulose-5-phosphate 4-epimerase/fuculose-1-phosphate aldolase
MRERGSALLHCSSVDVYDAKRRFPEPACIGQGSGGSVSARLPEPNRGFASASSSADAERLKASSRAPATIPMT